MLLLPRASANASNASVAGLGPGLGPRVRPGSGSFHRLGPRQGSKQGPGLGQGLGQGTRQEVGSGRKAGLGRGSSQRLGLPLSNDGSIRISDRIAMAQGPGLGLSSAPGPGPRRFSLKAKQSKNTILRRALNSKDQMEPVPAYRLVIVRSNCESSLVINSFDHNIDRIKPCDRNRDSNSITP